jgi:hypothetical protein
MRFGDRTPFTARDLVDLMPQLPTRPVRIEETACSRVAQARSWTVAGVALLVFAVALWQNLSNVDESQFHPDESRWINRSDYIDDLVDPMGQEWEDRYLTRGQPPMGSYVTGLGLFLQGRPLGQNGPWDFHFGNEGTIVWNLVKGNMPAPADILAARRTSAVVGALTCVTLFLVVTWLSHWVGGVIGALFLTFHPLELYLASLAVSDAVFTLFVALATLTALVLAVKPTWPRAIALGVVLGMGASTKLSPLFVAVALAGVGGIFLVDEELRRVPFVGNIWGGLRRGLGAEPRRLGWMLLAVPAIACATFVASYPYLWPDPIGRTQALLEFRQNEMANQARIWPTTAIDSRVEAIRRIWQNLEHTYSTSDRVISALGRVLGRSWSGVGIDLPIAVAGLALFALLTVIRGLPARYLLPLAVVGTQSAIILDKLSVDFNRYYLPLVFANALGVGFLAGQVSIWVQRALREQRTHIDVTPATADPLRHALMRLDRRRSQTGSG